MPQTSIVDLRREITKVLMYFSDPIPNMAHYGYTFIIYTLAQWTALLDNATQVVPPGNVGAYMGQDQTTQYQYEASKATFMVYKEEYYGCYWWRELVC